MSLQLTYNVIEFEKEMIDLIEVFEKALARELNPIIGKHL
jgi:hypothetical protein